MPAVMKLINNLNNINTCFSNGYELRGSMGNRQSHNNGLVMNGSNSNHLTRSTTRSQLKEPLTVECNGFVNSVSVRSDGVLVEKDAPGRLCRSKSKSCPGNGSQLGSLSPTDVVRPRRNIWKLPSCLLGTTAEDGRSNTTGTRTQCPVKTEANIGEQNVCIPGPGTKIYLYPWKHFCALWQNKVPHQSKILLPFERKSRPSTKSKQSVVPPPPPPPPPPEPEPIAPPRRRKRRLSSIIEEDSRPRKSPRCHASTQAILSSTPGQAPIARRSVYSEDGSYTGDVECTPLHEPDNFPECCEFARTNPYSCNVRRLVDKLAQQLNLNTAQLNLCEVLREYSRSYYASLSSSQRVLRVRAD
ncbi:uncharacterized protein LOC103517179 [Diaphorina citri]|uniref:Uncharacterized protein LOC103517179 n=1 Tax=Diaphorina citri TaxID=121845 RepID=A0A3Q0J9R8_DIACI|nr:uncharacterized protein LOC103517179 [Diaphorina citri]